VIVNAVTRSRVALAVAFGLLCVQFAVIGTGVVGAPLWKNANGYGIPAPLRADDGNVEMADALARALPRARMLAYTLWLCLTMETAGCMSPMRFDSPCLKRTRA
jgi:hypothetical protein